MQTNWAVPDLSQARREIDSSAALFADKDFSQAWTDRTVMIDE